MKFRKLFVLLMMSLVLAACGKTENSGNSKVESSTETSGGKNVGIIQPTTLLLKELERVLKMNLKRQTLM